MVIQPRLRALGIGELLDASFRLYRNHFLTFVAMAALLLVPYQLLIFVFGTARAAPQTQGELGYILRFTNNLSGPNDAGLLGFVFGGIVEPILCGAVILAAAACYQRQPASIVDGLRTAFGRGISLIGAALLSSMTAVMAALPMLAVSCFASEAYSSIQIQQVLGSFGTNRPPSNPSYILLIVLGVVAALLLLPVLVVTARLSYMAHAVVLEDKAAFESFDRSWLLTRPYIWRVVGYSLIVGLLSFCLFTLPAAAVAFGLDLIGVEGPLLAGLRLALTTIAEIIATPFSSIAYTLMFFDLRVRNEALDLTQNDLFAGADNDGGYEPSPSA